jgi:Zn-dependent M28 family amino/carboxypeptidase
MDGQRLMPIRPLFCALVLLVAGMRPQSAPPAPPSRLIDSAQLLRDLQMLSADDMQGRELGTPGGARARAYVVDRFRASGLRPFGHDFLQSFTLVPGRDSERMTRHGANVLGRIDGTREPAHFIVVSAHYDHIGMRNGVVFNGADDNASGTAALFALATYFTANPPAHSLLFAAFDGEEEGLVGSRAFVRSPPVDASALAVDLNADMIGRDGQNRLFVVGVTQQPALKPFIDRVAAHAPVRLLVGHDDPRQRGIEDWTRDSDQYAFMEAHIPALYFGVEDYAQHHKATDHFETMTVDFYVHAVETLVQVVNDFDAHLDSLNRPH